jgi:hypothetical protein
MWNMETGLDTIRMPRAERVRLGRWGLPFGLGLLAASGLAALYLGIVSWAESPRHALDLLWQDRWLVLPILAGFGMQAGLYAILKLRLYLPTARAGRSGALVGAGGATSTVSMVACCAHHVADVLPILGLTAAATFLAEHRIAIMLVGLSTTMIGIGVMILILMRERRRSLAALAGAG